MQIGMVGLGKMGGNMSHRLLNDGHDVVAYDRNDENIQALNSHGGTGVNSMEELIGKLNQPRVVWIMVPAGDPTEVVIEELKTILEEGDIIIDGGNSNYKDTIRRSRELREKGIAFVDVGTSGGVWGLEEGYSMMVGGDPEVVDHLASAFKTLAPAVDKGWGHVGKNGSGHFVKMIHNGIEYGMMQAYAEGFEIMLGKQDFDLDLEQVAEIWRFGSVIRSWLLDLTANALKEDQSLARIADYVPDSGEGRWTVFEAIDLDIPAPVITLSLLMRLVSRQDESYAAKVLAAMRNQFGGHAVKVDND
ncbi:MAG: decarboxylating 6-phosphogluconate dehydrogenase [Anaerolineales bacterium]|jgi:6-phosphogluconate dehydrogenase